MRTIGRLLGALVVAAGCAGEPTPELADEVDSLALSTPEELRGEFETLGHEISDLTAYLEANPGRVTAPSGDVDPRERLAAARRARAAVPGAIDAGDTAAAVDSLEAASARIEDVKRALGLAEEWGEELQDEPPPDTAAP